MQFYTLILTHIVKTNRLSFYFSYLVNCYWYNPSLTSAVTSSPTLVTRKGFWNSKSFLFKKSFRLTFPTATYVTQLFSHYLVLSTNLSDVNYTIHPYYNSFYLNLGGPNKLQFVNVKKSFIKWTHCYKFMYNIFYAKALVWTFTHKTLKFESLALNKLIPSFQNKLFKFTQSYFFINDSYYGDNASYIYELLSLMQFEFAFITDIRHHSKTLFFLRKYNIYTLGLVTWTSTPWLLNYTLPVGSGNLMSQYFFIYIILSIKQQACLQHYKTVKHLWFFDNNYW